MSKTISGKNKYKSLLFIAAKLLIGFGLITYFINDINFQQIKETIIKADYRLIILVFIMLLPNLFLQYIRWKIIIQSFFPSMKNSLILDSLFYGMSGAIITPYQVGEYVGRGLALKNYRTIKVIWATAIDKYISLFVLAVFGSATMISYLLHFTLISNSLALLLLLVLIVLVAFIIYIFYNRDKIGNKILARLLKIKFIRTKLGNVENLRFVQTKPVIKSLILSIIYLLFYLTQFALLILAFGQNINFGSAYMVAMLTAFSLIFIPALSFGYIGLREGSTIYFCAAFGIDASVGFNAAMALFFINLVVPAFIGLFFLIRKSE